MTAALAIACGVAVLLAIGPVLWRPLSEEWRLWRLREAEDPILRVLDTGSEPERARAAAALGDLRSTRAVPHLVRLLRTWGPRSTSVTGMVELHYTVPALVQIGPPAIPALREALGDKSEVVRVNAAIALERMGAPAAPALIAAFRDRRLPPDARANCGLALGRLRGAREVVPVLEAALQDEDWKLRKAAEDALSQIRAGQAPPSAERKTP